MADMFLGNRGHRTTIGYGFNMWVLGSILWAASATASSIADDLQSVESGIETVLVMGQRARMGDAIGRQRDADVVKSIVTNDIFGSLPDQNAAEAVRRLPGVSVLNDKGEGRYISIRGLDPELNNTVLDGIRLPSPEANTGAVALDTIPSDLIESIEVIKTLTPDMDADTLGGTIRINTFDALDSKDHLKLYGQTSYDNIDDSFSPEFGADASHHLSESLAIAAGISVSRRTMGVDNSELSDWILNPGGIAYAQEIQYRDYDIERERIAANVRAEFQASRATRLFLSALQTTFDETENRRRLEFRLNKLQPFDGSDRSARFISGNGDERIEIRRDLQDRIEGQDISTLTIGGETLANDWQLNYALSFADASEVERKAQAPTRFRRRFSADQLGVTFDFPHNDAPHFEIDSGQDLFLDPAGYAFNKIEAVRGQASDQEWTLAIDLTRQYAHDEGSTDIKGGFKLRQRRKDNDFTIVEISNFDGSYTLADVLGKQSYGLAAIDPVPDVFAVRSFFNANRDSFLSVEENFEDSYGEDYRVDEDVSALYAMARHETDTLILSGGLRMEHTEDTLRGNLIDVDAETRDAVHFSNDYLHWLPSISAKWQPYEDVVVRGGVFKSLARPRINKLAPRFAINEDFKAKFGNPELKPYEAWNADLSIEYYFADVAVLQAGLFYKRIDHFIVDRIYGEEDAPYFGQYNGVLFTEADIPVNGDDATVTGAELAYSQVYESGFMLGLNYTYTDTEAGIDARTIDLPAASQHIWNVIAGYERGPISLRLTVAQRSAYLDELGSGEVDDRHIDQHTQIDVSAHVNVSKNLALYAKLANIGDEPFIAYQNGPGRERVLQYEEYSWTGKFGVKLRF